MLFILNVRKACVATLLILVIFAALYFPPTTKEAIGYITCFFLGILFSIVTVEWLCTTILEDMYIDNLCGLILVVTAYAEKKGIKVCVNSRRNVELMAYAKDIGLNFTLDRDGLSF